MHIIWIFNAHAQSVRATRSHQKINHLHFEWFLHVVRLLLFNSHDCVDCLKSPDKRWQRKSDIMWLTGCVVDTFKWSVWDDQEALTPVDDSLCSWISRRPKVKNLCDLMKLFSTFLGYKVSLRKVLHTLRQFTSHLKVLKRKVYHGFTGLVKTKSIHPLCLSLSGSRGGWSLSPLAQDKRQGTVCWYKSSIQLLFRFS